MKGEFIDTKNSQRKLGSVKKLEAFNGYIQNTPEGFSTKMSAVQYGVHKVHDQPRSKNMTPDHLLTPTSEDMQRKVFSPLTKNPCRNCNCKKSNCLKLYCDCFSSGEYCSNCNCSGCYNNVENEKIRKEVIRSILERNPIAFRPKIASSLPMQLSPVFNPAELSATKHSKVYSTV